MFRKYVEFKEVNIEDYEDTGNPLAAYEPLEAVDPLAPTQPPSVVPSGGASSSSRMSLSTSPPLGLLSSPEALDMTKLIDVGSDSESIESIVEFNKIAKQQQPSATKKILAAVCIITVIIAAVAIYFLAATTDDQESEDKENVVIDYHSAAVIGSVPVGLTKRLAISGNIAYLADETAGVRALDITSPPSPVEVALLQPNENFKVARSLCVHKKTLAIADAQTGSILIYDVSSPLPKYLSQFKVTSRNSSDPSSEFLVYRPTSGKQQDVIFILDESSGLHLLNVKDPKNPKYLSVILHDEHPTNIKIHEDLAYVILRDKMAIVRVDDHINPLVVSKIEIFTLIASIDVSNQRAYLNDKEGGIYIINVSDDQNPVEIEVDEKGQEIAAAAQLEQRSAQTLESENVVFNTHIAVYGQITISASRGQVWVVSYEDNSDTPKKLKRIPELDGTHGFAVEDDFIYAVTQGGEFVVVKLSVLRKAIDPFIPKMMKPSNAENDIHWMIEPLLQALDKIKGIDVNMNESNLNKLDLTGMPEPSHMVHGVGALLDIRSSVANYFELYDTDSHLATLDGLVNVMSHNVPAPQSETSVRVNTFQCSHKTVDDKVSINIQLSALSLVPAYSLQPSLKELFLPISELRELWELLDRNAPPASDVTILDFNIYYEAAATVEIEISITKSKEVSITVKEYHAEVQILVDPVDMVIGDGLLSVADGIISLVFGVKSKAFATATASVVDDSTDLMSLIYSTMKPQPYGKLDVVLPLHTDSERFIPIVAIHDLDILNGKIAEMTVDLDLSFLRVQEKGISINHLNFVTSSLNQLVEDVSAHKPIPGSVYSDNLEYFLSGVLLCFLSSVCSVSAFGNANDEEKKTTTGINGTMDFDEVLDRYLAMHESYRQLGIGLPQELKLDEYRSRQEISKSVLFQRDILAKLQRIHPSIFGRFSDSRGADPSSGEKFEPINYIGEILEFIFEIPGAASGSEYGIEHLSWMLSLKSNYKLSRKNALAMIDLLPENISSQFDKDFEIPRNKSNGIEFSPEDYLPGLFTSLGIKTTAENATLMALGKFLATVPPTYGVNPRFQHEMLVELNNSYPALFGGFNSDLTNPSTGSTFDWRDYLPEVGNILRVDLRYERELNLIFGSSPTVGGFLSFLKNRFEYTSGMGTNFIGAVKTIKGDRYLTLDLWLAFDIDLLGNIEKVSEPVLNRALDGTGLEDLMKNRLMSVVGDIIPNIDGEFGARLGISVKVGMAISPLLKSRTAGRPQMYIMVPNMKLEGKLTAVDYNTNIAFSAAETSDLTFPIRNSNITLSFGFETSNDESNPIMIIDERSSLVFNTAPLLSSLKEIGIANMQLPVRFPSLKESALLSLEFEHLNNNSVGVAKAVVPSLPSVVTVSESTVISFLAGGTQFDFPIQDISFTETGLVSLITYMKEEGFGDNCPYKMLGHDQLTDQVAAFFAKPGDLVSYIVREWNIDLCSSAMTFLASTPTPFDVKNLDITSIEVELISNGSDWRGIVKADTTMFETGCEAELLIGTNWEVQNTSVSCDIVTPQYEFSTLIQMDDDSCNGANNGIIDYKSTTSGFEGQGIIKQKTTCGVHGDPLWEVAVSGSKAMLWDVKVSDANVSISSVIEKNPNSGKFETNWSGSVEGRVSIGESSNIVANVLFDNLEMTVASLDLSGSATIGPVSGTMDLSFDNTSKTLSGTGDLVISLKNSQLRGIASTITHVATYTKQNTHLPLWTVTGSSASLNVYGVEVQTATVNINGSISQTTTSWEGELSGKGSFMNGADLSVSANITKDEMLTPLSVPMTISSGEFEFIGTAEVSTDNEDEPCKAFEAMGDVTFSKLNTTFISELQYFRCLTGPTETLYEINANAVLQVPYNGITFNDAITGELMSTVAEPTQFEGKLTSSAMMFGNSALAEIPVIRSTLQETRIGTFFTTANGLISGDLQFDHINDCNTPSPGTGGATVRIAGLEAFAFRGPVEHNSCSGVVKMYGKYMNTWTAQDGKIFQWLEVNLTSSSHGGNPMASLSTRTWTGVITAHPVVGGVSQQYLLDTTNMNASAVIIWNDPAGYVSIAVALDGCKGQGTLAVRNLPGNIPPFEVGVNFSRPACNENAWNLAGFGRNLVIPFGPGKRLTIKSLAVEIANNNADQKSVRITGEMMGFNAEMSFQLQPFRNFSLVAQPNSGSVVNLGSISKEFVSPIGASVGIGHPDINSAMNSVIFSNVVLVVNFTEMYAYISADASFFGMPVEILIAAGAGSNNKWGFGFMITARDLSSRSGTPPVIETIIKELKLRYISFSICKQGFEVMDIRTGQMISFRSGISIRTVLGFNSQAVEDVMAVAPQDLAQQISGSKDPHSGGLIVVADILSISEVDVFVILAGNIPLGGDVVLREVALCFKISIVMSIGFLVKLDFTLGGTNPQVFQAGGFISMDTTGALTVGLSVDSNKPWDEPFGISGTKILFPVGIQMSAVPASPIALTRFSIIGGIQVGAAAGTVVIGADVVDFRKSAFKAEVNNLNVRILIEEVCGCKKCVEGPGEVLTDSSVDFMYASFNPDPFNEVRIHIGAVSEPIPPGTIVNITNMKIMGALTVTEATFKLDAEGLETSLQLQPVTWGPLDITAASNPNKGPSFLVKLTIFDRILQVSGQVQVLGFSATIDMLLNEKITRGNVSFNINKFAVIASLESTGKPLSSNHKSVIMGSFGNDINSQLADDSASATDSDLSASYTREHKKALKDKKSKQKKYDDEKREYKNKKAASDKKIDSAKKDLQKKEKKKNDAKCPKCKSFTGCFKSLGCNIVKTAKKAWEGAKNTLSTLENDTKKLLDSAEKLVNDAKRELDKAIDTLKKIGDMLKDLKNMIIQFDKNLIVVNEVDFSATLSRSSATASIKADITVAGNRLVLSYRGRIFLGDVRKAIQDKATDVINKLIKK